MVNEAFEEVLSAFWLYIISSDIDMHHGGVGVLEAVGYHFDACVAHVVLADV